MYKTIGFIHMSCSDGYIQPLGENSPNDDFILVLYHLSIIPQITLGSSLLVKSLKTNVKDVCCTECCTSRVNMQKQEKNIVLLKLFV